MEHLGKKIKRLLERHNPCLFSYASFMTVNIKFKIKIYLSVRGDIALAQILPLFNVTTKYLKLLFNLES